MNSRPRVLVAGLALCLWSNASGEEKIHPTANWMAPLKSKWKIQSPGRPYSIQTASDVRKNGEDSLRFELRKGEQWNTSFRSEVNTTEHPPMNSVRWYAFSLYLPVDFPIEDNRLVLAQWHGADKKERGEVARSPSMAFRYRAGRFYVTDRHTSERIVKDSDTVPETILFQTNSFPLGQWNDFVVQAKWSYQDDGFVNVWWNGKPIVQYCGPVGYNDDLGPYFKFGIYRDDTDKTYVAYYNQVKFGTNAEAVGFKP
jgi:hypothetical protein